MFPKAINLIWNSLSDWKVKYTQTTPNNNYITQIKLRRIDKELMVYGKIRDNYYDIGNIRNGKKLHNISLLKSNLQKAIRLGKTNEALMTSLNLIQKDIISFIRRILIISLEDVGAIPDTFPFITYILVSYPNIEITNEMVHILLLTVYRLSVYPEKHFPDSDIEILDYEVYDYSDSITNSLIIASEYGGYKGDLMLYYKFINSTTRVILPIKNAKLRLTRTITKHDILPSAVDFHCYPHILDEICKKTNLDRYTVKNLIWINSSSKNVRINGIYLDIEVWKNIKQMYEKMVKNIVDKLVLY